jgi:hypothetical protein
VSGGERCGVVEPGHPLHPLLADGVLRGQLGFDVAAPVFDAFQLDGAGTVFRYAERRSFVEVVGKFYGRKWLRGRQDGFAELRRKLMSREFENLFCARGLGLDAYPHVVVRPLLACAETENVLVEDYVRGTVLEHMVRVVASGGSGRELRERLGDVAWFLADLHARSRRGESAGEEPAVAYLQTMIGQLAGWEIVSPEQRGRLEALAERWAASGVLGGVPAAMVHGDAAPIHFILTPEHGVTAIDFERSRVADPAMDLGCLVAELKHLFWWHGHNPDASEPYIRHVYAAYAGCLSPGADDFTHLTERGRFFMACYELRTSRNHWLDLGYRRHLIDHAEACLQL